MRLTCTAFLFVMSVFSIGVWAQTPAATTSGQFKTEPMPKPMNRQVNVDDHLQMLSQEFDLTKAQQAKIRPILERYLQQRQQIELDSKLSPDAKSAKLQAGQHASYSKIRTLLTSTQKKKFDDVMGTTEDAAQHPSSAKSHNKK